MTATKYKIGGCRW